MDKREDSAVEGKAPEGVKASEPGQPEALSAAAPDPIQTGSETAKSEPVMPRAATLSSVSGEASSAADKGEAKAPKAELPPIDASAAIIPHFMRREERRERAKTGGSTHRPIPPQAAPSRTGRFLMFAATLGLAAAVGSAMGSIGYAGLSKLLPKEEPQPIALASAVPGGASNDEVRALRDQVGQIRGTMKALSDQLGSLKSSIDSSGKAANAQFGRLSERFEQAERQHAEPVAKLAKLADAVDRLERSDKQQVEMAAKLGKMAETLDRLERKTANAGNGGASDVTGSVQNAGSQANANGDGRSANEQRGNEARGGNPGNESRNAGIEGRAEERKVNGRWVVRRVVGGVALLEGPDGLFEIEPGETLPGGGKVEEIRRQDGKWMVFTSRGVILSR